MNKWKGSTGAKFAAWIGITISGVLFLASVVGAMAIWEGEFYDYTSEAACREDLYKTAANQYAIQVLDNMGVQMEDKWNDTNFRYGVIKADNIDELDLNDEHIYVESNFTEDVQADELYKISYRIGDNTYFSYSSNVLGGAFVGDRTSGYTDTMPIYQVVYDVDRGILYYESSSEFFPVREVKLGYGSQGYSLVYDFEEGMYYNLGVDGNDEITYIVENAKVVDVLQQEYITLSMLEPEAWSCASGRYLELDGEEYYDDGTSIWWVGSDYFVGKQISEAVNYEVVGAEQVYEEPITESAESEKSTSQSAGNEELTSEDTMSASGVYDRWLRVAYDEDPSNETYWVVVQMPEKANCRWSSDLYEQAELLATFGYGMRNSIYVILFVSLACSIAFFVFLLNAVGHRKGTDAIVETWLDRIPFDVYIGFWLFLEYFFATIVVNISYYIDQIPGIIIFVCAIICMCWLLLLAFLSFAVRVKRGKWWHNTVIWMGGHAIWGVIKTIFSNMHVLWKAILAIGALSLVEFWVLAWDGFGRITMFWFVEKIILVPLLLLAIVQMQKLKTGAERMAEGDLEHSIDTEKMFWEFRCHGENLNSISSGMSRAVDERMKSERFKTELITNVSHDIKTPLTSIINYVDLLEKEDLQNEKATEYLDVLERQSARLKKLIEDLMEASKASTGNLAVHLERLEAGVSLVQIVGEFEEKMQANELKLVIEKPENPIYIQADSRHFWRVVDNLMNNICKYAQAGTRVYVNLEEKEGQAVMTFRNTSKYPLNISSEALMERFVRGDSSRNTEGNGLGLSIASSLMELMGGSFELYVDGDLFKVMLRFPSDSTE